MGGLSSFVLHFLLVAVAPLSQHSLAQFPPRPTNLTTVVSPTNPNITVTYKVPSGACNTTFDTQQQYTGWVKVPGTFPSNLFFWFVAAREPTSALTIWLNGGPGSSSMFGMFTELGPCEVIEEARDRIGTRPREWGWDRLTNMLFIDQPNEVGFSYDTPTNRSVDLISGNTLPLMPLIPGQTEATFLNGTFSSGLRSRTVDTSEAAAEALWHMLQGFLGAFPQYNPPASSALGVNLFAESYGGIYGPVFADTWAKNNDLISSDESFANATEIRLTSVGIVNGCVDDTVQGPSYVQMARNNTYGIELYDSVVATLVDTAFVAEGRGCLDLALACRNASAAVASGQLSESRADDLCNRATIQCDQIRRGYQVSGRSYYDIAHNASDPFPANYYLEWLNTASVQEAIGTPVNHTDHSLAVAWNFYETGDSHRDDPVGRLVSLIRRGIRVALLYGDRDYICNWIGGEAVSLSIASRLGAPYSERFPAAGYADVMTNESYVGGVTRQFGNLSFTRVYQAGHFVPASQPETGFQLFARVVLGTSLSTGESVDLSDFATEGAAAASVALKLPDPPKPVCWLRAISSTCPPDLIQSIEDGEGVIINGVWYESESDWPGPTPVRNVSHDGDNGGVFTPSPSPSSSPDNSAVGRGPSVTHLFTLGSVAGLIGLWHVLVGFL